MKVVFSCVTNYTIFISYILIKTMYKKDYNILIANEVLISKETIDRIRKTKIWDEIIYSKDDDYNEKIQRLKNRNIDVFNMYNIEFCESLFEMLFYKEVEFNLIEEGTATWNLDRFLDYYIKNSNQLFTKEQIQKRISNVLVLNDKLIESEYNFLIKNIQIDNVINNIKIRQSYLDDLNYIFGYMQENINSNVIYFDNNLSQAFIASRSDDIYLNYIIIDTFDKILIKPHPNDYKYKYDNVRKDMIINNKNIPWEIIYLNNIEKIEKMNLLYLTNISTAIFSTKILNKKSKIKSISLYNLVNKAFNSNFNNKIREYKYKEHIQKYNQIYGETVYIPDTIEEYLEILKKLNLSINENALRKYNIYFEKVNNKVDYLGNSNDFIFLRTTYWLKKLFADSKLKICLWGTGSAAEKTLSKMQEWNFNYELTNVIDNFKKGSYKEITICTQERIESLEYDIIFICTSISKIEVEEFLINKGLKYGKNFVYGYSI